MERLIFAFLIALIVATSSGNQTHADNSATYSEVSRK